MEDKNWFEKYLSLDEFKISSLVIVLYALVTLAIFICLEKGDVPPNLTALIIAALTTIGGTTAFNLVSKNIANRNVTQSTFTDQNLTTTTQTVPAAPIIEINQNKINNNSTEIDPTTRGI